MTAAPLPWQFPVLGQLMARLDYPKKFALISAVFLLPISLLLYFFNAEVQSNLALTHLELLGTQYLRPLQQLLMQNGEAGTAALQFNRQTAAARPILVRTLQEMELSLAQLAEKEKRTGVKLGTSDPYRILEKNWEFLRAQALSSYIEIPEPLFTEFSTDLRVLISRLGDGSNLILDPDLPSYYVMDATVLKWPRIQELLIRTRSLGIKFALAKKITASEQAELTAQLGVLESLKTDLQKGMQVSFVNDRSHEVESALQSCLQACIRAIDSYNFYCHHEFLGPEKITVEVDEFNAESRYAIVASADFWTQGIEQLDHLLQERIARYEKRFRFVLMVVGSLLLLAASLFAAFYFGVMRTVVSIRQAGERMNRGDYGSQIHIETRDELGQVVRSFNAVAEQLRGEYLQAKEESARALAAEVQWKESETRYRSVFEHAVEGMFQTTPEGRYLAANQALADIYGYATPQELMERVQDITYRLYVDPARREEFRGVMERDGVVKDFVSEVFGNKGQKIWISENARAVRNSQGEILYYEGTVTDITSQQQMERTRRLIEEQQRQAKEDAEKASRAKSDFLANMSHELRTPLNGILGYTQILKRSPDLNPKFSSGLNVIHQSAEHLLTLINDILDLSKIEADRMDLQLGEFELRDFLQNIGDILRIRATQKKITFHEQWADDLPRVIRADEKRLRQILINLLGNAVKFTDRGGVTLRVTRQGTATHFAIDDTGVGIPADKIGQLFKAFSQVGDQKRNAEGTGLGLAMSQRLVQLMGGVIEVKSRADHGSTFSFQLELPEVSVSLPMMKEKPREIVGYHGLRRNLLVVDDIWENRAVLNEMLTPLGFTITEAENGREALDKILEQCPDLVLTDLVMPVMDGFELTRRIRANEVWKDLVIVTVSASIFDFDAEKSRQAGCNDFVAKPVHLPVLLACLQKYLQLDWIYEGENAAMTSAISTAEAAALSKSKTEASEFDLPPIPREVGDKLLDLAKRGDVKTLLETAQILADQQISFVPWVDKLRELAENFRVKQIRQLIQDHVMKPL